MAPALADTVVPFFDDLDALAKSNSAKSALAMKRAVEIFIVFG